MLTWLRALLLLWATTAPAARAAPAEVVVGVHLDDVLEVDLKAHAYAVDAYIWFRWTDPDLDPSLTFEIANPFEQWGHMLTPIYDEPEVLDDGTRYQVVRFQGKLSRKLPLYSYPFDRQTLVLQLEDGKHDTSELVYVLDPDAPTMSDDVELPGYRLGAPTLSVAAFRYPTAFGDPRAVAQPPYSRVTLAVPLTRPPVAYAAKLFLPVLAVVVCAALMFLLSPQLTDARVDVGITALLTVVALQITYGDALPDVGYLMLMDKVYLLAYAFVLAGLAVVVWSTRLAEAGNLDAAASLHRRALGACFGAWAVGMTLLVAQAAMTG